MTRGTFFKFDGSHHAVMVLLVLGATLALVLPIAQVPLLRFPFQFPV